MAMTKDEAMALMEKMKALSASGYAGVLPNGNIVDRREYPDALPSQENWFLGISTKSFTVYSCPQSHL